MAYECLMLDHFTNIDESDESVTISVTSNITSMQLLQLHCYSVTAVCYVCNWGSDSRPHRLGSLT